jgi:hypothetical protein
MHGLWITGATHRLHRPPAQRGAMLDVAVDLASVVEDRAR